MKTTVFIILLYLLAANAVSQNTVKGYVFEDLNDNSKKDRNEKGIAGVAVSNGEEIATTNAKGEYLLPIGDDNIIFVIKPVGYKTPVNDKNQPQFYYNHKPAGSHVEYKYEGVQPTGKLPKSVDFALIKNEENDHFRFFAFGDPQTANATEVEYFKKVIVDEAKNIDGIPFGISLGDVVFDDLSIFPIYRDAIAEMGIPWHTVMGNHDRNKEAKNDKMGDETFEKYFGPANYVFQYAKTHIFILDDIISPTPDGVRSYQGGLRDDQLKFIENYLKLVNKNDLLIFCMHIPLLQRSFDEPVRSQLLSLLKGFENLLVLSAHTHIQRQIFSDQSQGWEGRKPLHEFNVGTTNGNWYSGEYNELGVPESTMADGTPKGYAIVNVKGNTYTFDYKVAGKPMDYAMNIYCPKIVKYQSGSAYSVYVNFLLGSEQDLVEYRIDGGNWQKMNLVEEFDPHFIYLSQRWDYSDTLLQGRRPGSAQICRHLWKGPVSSILDEGKHTIEVRAIDLFGRTHQANTTYTIMKQ